jgi:hypothetical protein
MMAQGFAYWQTHQKSGASAIQRGLPSHQQDLFKQKQKSSIDTTTVRQETIMKDLL